MTIPVRRLWGRSVAKLWLRATRIIQRAVRRWRRCQVRGARHTGGPAAATPPQRQTRHPSDQLSSMIMSLHGEVTEVRCELTEMHRLLILKPNVSPQQESDDKLYEIVNSLYGKLVQFREEYAEKHRQVAVAVNMLADQSHIRDAITRAVKNIAVELPNISSIVRAIQDTNHHKECREVLEAINKAIRYCAVEPPNLTRIHEALQDHRMEVRKALDDMRKNGVAMRQVLRRQLALILQGNLMNGAHDIAVPSDDDLQ